MSEPGTLFIRVATLPDLPAIVRIYNQTIPDRNATCDLEDSRIEDRIQWLRSHNEEYPLWVAESGKRVIGWACISPYSSKSGYRKTVENSVYVDRAFRCQGVGRALMARTIDETKELGYHAILAKVFAHNPASLALHRAFGFTEMGFLKEVALMDDIYRDIVILVLLLDRETQPRHDAKNG